MIIEAVVLGLMKVAFLHCLFFFTCIYAHSATVGLFTVVEFLPPMIPNFACYIGCTACYIFVQVLD